MKKCALPLAMVLMFSVTPASAQQEELAKLRAEIAAQQAAMAKLLARIDALEKQLSNAATKDELEDEAKTQQDSVNSVRETIANKVNINGYANVRFHTDEPEAPSAFQLDSLGLILGKQTRKFSFLAELEFSNTPHHAESVVIEHEEGEEGEAGEEGESEEHVDAVEDISGEGEVAVENAWVEYNHNAYFNVRVGKQLSPQYWWQHRYPNLTYSTTRPIYLRELFPPELVGVMVRGQVSRPVGTSEWGLGYSVYASNNNFEGNSQSDLHDGKAWGARVQVRFPTGGALKRLDFAADMYRGKTSHEGTELVDDDVNGFEGQLEFSRLFVNGEYARGESEGVKRIGYYFQPAVQLHSDWIGFYRVEQLESPRLQRAERRHLAGLNYRPFAQVAVKGEWYRSNPLERSFIVSEEERKSFSGFAAAMVFFF